jgi:hypothetical protein
MITTATKASSRRLGLLFKKKIGVKESPIKEVSYWRKNKEVRWVRRLYWALFLDWAYFSILRFVGLSFEPRLFSLTMPFSSPVGPFLFLHFFFSFSTRLGHLSSSFTFFFAALSGPLFLFFLCCLVGLSFTPIIWA